MGDGDTLHLYRPWVSLHTPESLTHDANACASGNSECLLICPCAIVRSTNHCPSASLPSLQSRFHSWTAWTKLKPVTRAGKQSSLVSASLQRAWRKDHSGGGGAVGVFGVM